MPKPPWKQKEDRFYDIPGLGKVPSVTTITGQLDKSGPLVGWAKKVMGNYLLDHQKEPITEELIKLAKQESRRVSEEALEVGSNVHNCIEVHLRGQKVDGLLQEDPRIVKPYKAFLKWEKGVSFKPLKMEHKVWSKIHRFAGTLDIIGLVYNLKKLVDLKASKAIYPEYILQLSGYKIAHEEMTNEDLDGAGILRLDKEEAYPEWKPYPNEELYQAGLRFLKLLEYWWLANKGKV